MTANIGRTEDITLAEPAFSHDLDTEAPRMEDDFGDIMMDIPFQQPEVGRDGDADDSFRPLDDPSLIVDRAPSPPVPAKSFDLDDSRPMDIEPDFPEHDITIPQVEDYDMPATPQLNTTDILGNIDPLQDTPQVERKRKKEGRKKKKKT